MNMSLDDRINGIASAVVGGTSRPDDRESLLLSCRQYALRYVRSKGLSFRPCLDEDDYAQEICIKADNAIRRYDPARALFTTLLQSICRNTRLDILRESARRNAVEIHGRIDDIADRGYDEEYERS